MGIMRDIIRDVVSNTVAHSVVFLPSMLTLVNGFGGESASAISLANRNVLEWDGNLVPVPTAKHALSRGRLVVNEFVSPEDLTATWVVINGATIDGTNLATLTGISALIYQDITGPMRDTVSDIIVLAIVSVASSSDTIRLRYWGDVSGVKSSPDIPVTTTPQLVMHRVLTSVDAAANAGIMSNSAGTTGQIIVDGLAIVNVTGLPADYVPEFVVGNQWFSTTSGNTVAANIVTEAPGVPLHPTKALRGAVINVAKQDRFDSTAYIVGEEYHSSGGWFIVDSLVGAGNSAASPPTFDMAAIGNTTVDGDLTVSFIGLYQRDYGVMQEGSATNIVSATNWRLAAGWTTGWGGGTNVTIVQQTNGDLGVKGVANKEVIISDVDNAVNNAAFSPTTIVSSANQHWLMVAVRIGSGTHIPMIRPYLSGGTAVSRIAYIDTNTGELSADSPVGTFVVKGKNHYYVYVPITDNASGNNIWYALIHPAARATLNGSTVVTLTGSVTVDWPQKELNAANPHSPVAAGATAADALGSVKWPSPFFNHPEFTTFFAVNPQYGSGDITAANQVFCTLNNGLGLVYRSGATTLSVTDGTNTASVDVGVWNRGDPIQGTVRASASGDSLQISARNGASGADWVHGTATAYDRTLPDTGFLQNQKAGEDNDLIWQQPPVHWKDLVTNAELASII